MARSRVSSVLLLATLLAVFATLTAAHSRADRALSPKHDSAQAVVQRYFKILNAGMQNGDFSAMRTVYASDGVLTQSNPLGETKVSRGLAQIIAFYQAAYTKFKGGHWTQDSTRLVANGVVLNYEFAGDSSFKVPGRCAHLFSIKNGRIKTLDWITFYSGQK